MSEENRRKLAEIIKEFDNYAVGETNETYEHYIFNSREQKEGEPIDSYVAELRTLAQLCNFCTCLQDSLIALSLASEMGKHASGYYSKIS